MHRRTLRKHVIVTATPYFVSFVAVLSLAQPARAIELSIDVDCSKPGQSITQALGLGEDLPMTVTVRGTCRERVLIHRSQVTLQTTEGAAIEGPDPTKPTVEVQDDEVTIDGFTITGGSVGVLVNGAQRTRLANLDIEQTPHAMQVEQGANAVIDHCVIRHNQFGITTVTGASFSLTNSTVSNNLAAGIQLAFDSSATIGLAVDGTPGGNTIAANGGSGIQIRGGSFAAINNNAITGNGSNRNPVAGQSGIDVFEAGANIGGGNNISDNGVFGIDLKASRAIIGTAAPSTAPGDIISGNGGSPAAGDRGAGIFVSVGSSVELTGETISNNIGAGLAVALGSSVLIDGQAANAKLAVSGNSGDGVQLSLGGELLIDQSNLAVAIAGNGGFDLDCIGARAAAGGSFAGVAKISPACAGF